MTTSSEDFHTWKGYRLQYPAEMTESMEDYLEMIGRHIRGNGYIRIHALAEQLHVRPSSASKMVAKLRELSLVSFERYGIVTLTEKGNAIADYLLWRHDVLMRFFGRLNGTDPPLKLVEQVEHFLDKQTVTHLEQLLDHWPERR